MRRDSETTRARVADARRFRRLGYCVGQLRGGAGSTPNARRPRTWLHVLKLRLPQSPPTSAHLSLDSRPAPRPLQCAHLRVPRLRHRAPPRVSPLGPSHSSLRHSPRSFSTLDLKNSGPPAHSCFRPRPCPAHAPHVPHAPLVPPPPVGPAP